MDNRVKFYSWLISLLERRRLTFEEIANEWRDANANPEGEELQLRTFHRYRKAIESQLASVWNAVARRMMPLPMKRSE